MSDPADLPLSFYPHATGPKGTMSQLGFSGKLTLRDRSVSRRFIRESSRDHYMGGKGRKPDWAEGEVVL